MERRLALGFYFKQIHDKFEQHLNQKLKSLDLTLSQMAVLVFLFDHQDGKVTQKDIAKHLDLAHPTVVGLLKRLESKELIRSYVDSEDRRFRVIVITEKAKAIRKELDRHLYDMDSYLVHSLTPEEHKNLILLLPKVLRSLAEKDSRKPSTDAADTDETPR